MAVSTYQFTDCPVVHLYSAFTEESHAYLRRQNSENKRPIKPTLTQISQDKVIESESTVFPNMTILRHANLVIAYNRIAAIRKDRRSTGYNFNTTYISILQGNESVAVTMNNGKDILEGIAVVLGTTSGPLLLEFLPVHDNWYLTRAMYGSNESYHPRDLIFFSAQFSLCCEIIKLFSARDGRIVLYSFHIDFIQDGKSIIIYIFFDII